MFTVVCLRGVWFAAVSAWCLCLLLLGVALFGHWLLVVYVVCLGSVFSVVVNVCGCWCSVIGSLVCGF